MKKIIANARKSTIPRHRDEEGRAMHQNFQGETVPEYEGVPKAIAILIKRRSPSRHHGKRQILNASKSISGTGCAGDRSEFAQEPAIG